MNMKAKEVKKILDITQPTLSKYIKEGRIRYTKISNNNYWYNEEDVYRLIGIRKEKHKRINISYARISNANRKQDLESQSQRIYEYCISKGIDLDTQYKDIKSGMNFNRIELNNIINLIIKGKIEYIIIENKDRLCRFGFELFEQFSKKFGTKIIIINDSISNKSYEQEMTEDLVSIIHYFSMKMYSNRRKLNKIKKELQDLK